MYSDKVFKRKRLLSLMISAGYSLCGGIEYAIILPTAWNYMESLGVTEEYYLGFMFSAYSFAGAVAGVIGGRLSDMYPNHTKLLIMSTIILRSFGNFQYLLGISVWNILAARLVCGIGTAAGTTVLAEICRTTTLEERTPIMSINNAMSELGILIGPAFQFLFSYFNFSLFGIFHITPMNAPGLFMGVFWLCYWVATSFMFHNLAEEFDRLEKLKKNVLSAAEKNGIANSMNGEKHLSGEINGTGEMAKKNNPRIRATYAQYKHEFLTDTFVLIFFMLFTLIVVLVGIETIIVVITQDRLDFDVFDNSLIYMVGGFEALVLFFILGIIGKHVRDSTIQIIGWVFTISAVFWLMAVIPIMERDNVTHVVLFCMGLFILYLGNPFTFISCTCLMSKILSNETQGLGQGLLRLSQYMGLIFGPVWAGATVRSTYLFLGVFAAILLINGVMLAGSFKKIRAAEDAMRKSAAKNAETETAPLLGALEA